MILCCGEALVDMLPATSAEGAAGFTSHCGGAVYNTAIALGRLGANVGLVSGISTDMFGGMLMEGLEESGVDGNTVIRSDRPSTLAFVKLTDGNAEYSFFDENSAGRMLVPSDMPAIPAEVSALFFGGISLACEPCAEAYEALCLSQADSKVIALDPNVRPGFISDEARYRARLNRMIAAADIVKVSDEDLAWINSDPGDLQEMAGTLLQMGPSIIVVTRGAKGAIAFTGNGQQVEIPARPTEVVDTVGAGDTFNAGLLWSLGNQGALTRTFFKDPVASVISTALDAGSEVASFVVGKQGAEPPWLSDLRPART